MCVLAAVNACVLSFFYRRQLNSYFTAVFFSVVVANFGYLFLALSTSLEGAIIANKMCYLGSCFLPMFLFFAILRLCNFNFPTAAKLGLGLFSFVVFGLSCTVGYSDIYYKSIQFVVSDGIGDYIAEFGPAHVLWNILLVGYAFINIVVIVYAAKKKSNVSYKNLTALALIVLLTISSFLFARVLACDTLVMPIVYILDEFALLYVCVQVKMYDITNSVLESLEAENICAYVAFSPRGYYLGCNDIAMKYFPELVKLRVDHPLPRYGQFATILQGWIKDMASGLDDVENQFVFNGRYYKSTLRDVRRRNRSRIFLFRIEDETKIQQYIEHLDSNNSKLENVIKSNANHIHAIQEQMIVGMAKMVESRDSNTGGHIKRTSAVVAILANEMQKDDSLSYSKDFYNALIAAAPMHDLGKIAIDDQILRKPGRFTDEEFAVMKTHAEKGCAIVENLLAEIETPFFVEIAKNVACYHHERWNGTGYPFGFAGEQIPFEARVMAVADVYDALVSRRCYKDQTSFSDAYNLVVDSMGSHFDPCLKKYFVNCRNKLEDYYRSVDH